MKCIPSIAVAACCSLLWATACTERKAPITKKALIEQELERRKQKWEAGWIARCWEEVYAEASRRADSLIIERVRQEQLRQRGLQRKQPPSLPQIDFPEDTLPLAPLLRDTSWLDTLRQHHTPGSEAESNPQRRYRQ